VHFAVRTGFLTVALSATLFAWQHGGAHASVHSSPANVPITPVPLGTRGFAAGYTGINAGALNTHSSYGYGRNSRLNGRSYSRYPAAYFFDPYYYPSLDYANSPYYYDQGTDPYQQNAEMTANMLGEQVARLSAEVAQMRQEGAPAIPPYASPQNDPAPPAAPPITVVLRSGQKLQVQSYAVMNSSFWDFSKEPARRIPLSNIDIAASTKATEANGAEFPQINETN
jgi:hypothetical protein